MSGSTDSAINFSGSADLHTSIHPPPNALSETETESGAEPCIHLREDLYFDQPTGPRIEIEEDMKAVDFFQLYFTDTVWNHIVDQRAHGMIILVCPDSV